MRVFEVKIDYLTQELDLMVEKGKIMSQKDVNIRSYIIGEAYNILNSNTNHKSLLTTETELKGQHYSSYIELCHYVQTDGINVQISWCQNLN